VGDKHGVIDRAHARSE